MAINETEFGNRIREILDQGAPLDPRIARRLAAARRAALERQRPEPAPAWKWADNVLGRIEGWGGLSLRILAPLALLVAGAVAVYAWQQNQRLAELEEIDAQLLSDELPIDAYLDRGFQSWLKKRAAEQ
jgi:hypothetical protein